MRNISDEVGEIHAGRFCVISRGFRRVKTAALKLRDQAEAISR